MFLKREQWEGGSDLLHCGNGQVLFKDYLKQQIDHLMTGDAGRDGVAEGRRGTHVEVCLADFEMRELGSPLQDFSAGSG